MDVQPETLLARLVTSALSWVVWLAATFTTMPTPYCAGLSVAMGVPEQFAER